MPIYTVETAGVIPGSQKEWNGNPMHSIGIRFTTGEEAEWYTRATNPPPVQGAQMDGTIEDSSYGKKFKKTRKEGGGGGRFDPEKDKKITRLAAQKAAVELLKHPAYASLTADQVKTTVKAMTDFFAEDAAPQSAPQTLNDAVVQGEIPAQSAEPIPF